MAKRKGVRIRERLCGKIWSQLFQSNLSAFSIQLLLDIFSFFLGNAFLQNLRSAVYNFLSFLQAQTGNFTNNLDNLNLVRANLGQFYVELGLFLSCCCFAD